MTRLMGKILHDPRRVNPRNHGSVNVGVSQNEGAFSGQIPIVRIRVCWNIYIYIAFPFFWGTCIAI